MPTPRAKLDYGYCVLSIDESEVSVGDIESSRFIHQLSGRVQIFFLGGTRKLDVGTFSILVVDLETAINEGVEPFHVFDSDSKTAPYYGPLYLQRSWSGTDFRASVTRAVCGDESIWRPNLLILDRLAVYPEHRGQGVGLLAIRGLIERFRMGIGLIVMKPYPLQFESEPTSPKDVETRRRLGLDDFRMGYKPALAKLRSYYATLGFRCIPRTSLMGLAPEHYVPDLD
jgi:GNAT superfamily N-acetyltransferase